MAQEIVLRDRNQVVIGYINTEWNNEKVLRDRNRNIIGYYCPNDNTTRDRTRRIVAYGDVLTSLL